MFQSRHVELIILVVGVLVATQWPHFVFAKNVSWDEFAESTGAVTSAAGVVGAYKVWCKVIKERMKK